MSGTASTTSTIPHPQKKQQQQQQQRQESSLGSSIADYFRNMFLCCSTSDSDDEYNDSPSKPISIGSPTNFRRHELSIHGLTPDMQDRLRRKQQEDAIAMYNDLRPLQSSPSSQFAERPPTARATNVSYEQFTQPRMAPSPMSPGQRVASHARKLSESLSGGRKASGGVGDVEMRGLIQDRSRTEVNVPPPSDVGGMERWAEGYKVSEESLDSAKGGMGRF